MIDLFEFALNSIDIGIILIDDSQTILFWNKYLERISHIRHDVAVGKHLCDVCETFKKNRYQDIITSVFKQNAARFCSSKLHKAFIYPATGDVDRIRQNMTIEPTTINSQVYALIQIDDITDQVNNEYKLTSLINELKKGYIEVKESEEINKRLAQTDPLTKIANRHCIVSYLNEMFEEPQTLDNHALLFLDLDGFKGVNDTYGHLMGDNLLIRVASTIKNKIRRDDIVARLGGDEFLVLLSNIGSVEAVSVVGQKLVSEIAKPIIIDSVTLNLTVSIGVALFDRNIKSTSEFIKIADEAMYRAKHGGKNKFVVYTKENIDKAI